jgi:hypothetical protein
MTKIHYNPMRKLTLILALVALPLLVAMPRAAQQPTTLRTAALESHEGMTISAQPWMEPSLYKEKFPKKSPFAAGVLAVQVSFRNDSDDTVKVNLERIRLSVRVDEDNRQQIEPLTPDQVADATIAAKHQDPTAHRRLPFPTGGAPKAGRDKNWIEVHKDAENAAVPSSVVAPHRTVQGLLYFDLQGQFDLLTGAHLYVPNLQVLEKGRSLLYFEIDLSRSGSS